MNNTPTRLIDIPSTILAILILLGGVVLFYVGKITWVEFSFCLGAAIALIGGTAALKAPSPAQAQQLDTLADKAQAHDTQIQTQQQQLGQVQDLAVRAATTATQVQAQVQAAAAAVPPWPQQPPPQTPGQETVNLSTMPMPLAALPQFMQPDPQPVQEVDYGRHWGDSMPMAAVNTQKIPTP